jgi:Fe-S cluster assembly protein SufD
MTIHSFLKIEKGDPDWQFSPTDYVGKEVRIIDVNTVELDEEQTEEVVLRQNPIEKELLAKHLHIHVQRNANLSMTILNELDSNIRQIFLYNVYLKFGSSITFGLFTKNGKFNKHIIQVHQEEFTHFSAYGLISNMSGGDTEIITKIIHRNPNSISSQVFLGVAGKDSQTVFQGMTMIESSAINSEIRTENFNLIVETSGRCYSKPENYIAADYVTNSQRSETNTISLEKISYLQSRGISEKNAKKMIISGFRNQIINQISQDNIREEVKKMYID